jgi:polysaccharide export outer membrane protein
MVSFVISGFGLRTLVFVLLVLQPFLGAAQPSRTAAPIPPLLQRQYRIGNNDVIKITVLGHDDLTRTAVVSADGLIAFPLVGDVKADGLTPAQLEAELKQRLEKDYLIDPQVSVVVQEHRSQRVFVLGEADKPGTYYLTGEVRLIDVLSQAGGPGKSAGQDVQVIRGPKVGGPVTPGAAGSTTLRVNLRKLLDGDPTDNLILQDGDTIFIPKSASFFVQGEVRKPGAYALEKATTAVDAITMAGGLTDRAAPATGAVLRKRPDGSQQRIPLDLSGADPRAREVALVDGDTVVVPAGNTFYILGEVKKPGAYQLDQAATVLEGVALAGGFTDKAAPNRTRVIRNHKDGRQESIVIDLNDVMKRGRKDKDVSLSPNDVIVVPESYF